MLPEGLVLSAVLDALVLDAPVPPESVLAAGGPGRAWPSDAGPPPGPLLGKEGESRAGARPPDLDAALAATVAELDAPRLGILLDGSPASAVLGLYVRARRPDALAVTLRWGDEAVVDDAGDVAAWLELPRRQVTLAPSLVATWARLVDARRAPVASLDSAAIAVAAQAVGVDRLLVPSDAGLFAPAPRGWPWRLGWAAARQHYGVVPAGWEEWRRRLELRRELLDPALVAAHSGAVAAPPRAPLDPAWLATLPAPEAQARLLLATTVDGGLRPELAAASELAGVAIAAPLLAPTVVAAALATPRRASALRRLAARRLPDDLLARPPRRRRGPAAQWLCGEPLPAPVAAALAPAALARVGLFDPVTVHYWRQLVTSDRPDPLHGPRLRMLMVATAVQRLESPPMVRESASGNSGPT